MTVPLPNEDSICFNAVNNALERAEDVDEVVEEDNKVEEKEKFKRGVAV